MKDNFIRLLAGFLAFLPAAALAENNTREYTVSIAGNEVGSRTVTRTADNSWRYHFEFSDRGRGPDLVAELKTDTDGIPLEMTVTGMAYFKSKVDESFVTRDGEVRWHNVNETGSSDAGAFYVAFNDATGVAPLLRALLKSETGSLPLLPSGTASVESVRTHTVEHDGKSMALTLYAVSGLGFAPAYAWASDAGDVFYDGWVIRKGWEPVSDELDAIATELKAQRYATLAGELALTNGEALLVTNARVFDPKSGEVTDGANVLVRDGTIVAVGSKLDESVLPPVLDKLDAGGRFLMPGLYDMHVHNFGDDGVGLEHLAGGVTTVRDLAAPLENVLGLRQRWHTGETLGPRVHLGGFMDGPGKYAGPSKVLVDTRDEALDAVRKYADSGYVQVKLYNSIKHDLVPVIIEAAHARDMKVSGHIPVHMFAEEAVELGYDEIQHINHLFLNFMDRDIDNRTPARFTEVGEHGAELDLRSRDVREFIRFLAQNDTVVDPTLAIFESDWVSRPGDVLAPRAPVADRLPPMVRRRSLWSGLEVPAELDARYKEAFRRSQAFVKELHDAGVTIVAGTDFMPGFALHRELELYAEAGIDSAEVLRIATLGAAEVMREADRHGRVAPGYVADFILVDGDPLARMSDIRRVSHVVRAGRLYEVAGLQLALGMTPAE